jgi:hypothetical protein
MLRTWLRRNKSTGFSSVLCIATACVGVLLVACTPPSDELSGEWVLEIQRGSGVMDAPAAVGIIVLDDRIAAYGPTADPIGRVGRAYIDWEWVFEEVDRASLKSHYLPEEYGDMFEEVDVVRKDDGEISLIIAPQVFDYHPEFSGTYYDNHVVGTWVVLSHSDTLITGSFRMTKSRRTVATDSAVVRSRRAAQRWSRVPD